MEQLSLLPDSVKLRVLALCSHGAGEQRSDVAQAPPPPPHPRDASDSHTVKHSETCSTAAIYAPSTPHSTAVPLLPSLSSGLAVVDGFLSQQLLQAAHAEAQALLKTQLQPARMGGSGSRWLEPSARGDLSKWLHPGEEGAEGRHALEELMLCMGAVRAQLLDRKYDVGGHTSFQLACYPGGGARYVRHRDASDSAPARTITAIMYLNPSWDAKAGGGQLAVYNTSHSTHTQPVELRASSSCSGGGSVPAAATHHSQSPELNASSSCKEIPTPGPEEAVTCTDLGPSPSALASEGSAGPPQPASPASFPAPDVCTCVAPLGGRLVVFESGIEHEVLPCFSPRYALTTWFHKAADRGPAAPKPAASPQQAAGEAAAAAAAAAAPAPCAQASDPTPPAATASTASALPAASVPASPSPKAPTIFVSIVCYRDPETRWTLWDMFKKAALPERIHVGVVWQVDAAEDSALLLPVGAAAGRPPAWLSRVREVRLPYQQAEGPCLARHLAQALWRGEDYVLQLDAHMRFTQGWDTAVIQQLHAVEEQEQQQQGGQHPSPGSGSGSSRSSSAPKVVLSTYPPGYEGSGAAAVLPDMAQVRPTLLCAGGFGADGLLRLVARSLEGAALPAPLRSPFWAAGFSFSRSALLQEVPVPATLPHLFFGEEIYMLARMWTRGWQVYAPSCPLLFHQWQRSSRAHTIQEGHQGQDRELCRAHSQQKVLAMLGAASWPDQQAGDHTPNGVSDCGTLKGNMLSKGAEGELSGGSHPAPRAPEAGAGCLPGGSRLPPGWRAGEVWGLGAERSLRDFEAHLGVSFSQRTLQDKAVWGGLGRDAFMQGDQAEGMS